MPFTLTIPILSEKISREGQPAEYRVAMLLSGLGKEGSEGPVIHHPREDRALESLEREMRKFLNTGASELQHDWVQRVAFCPDLTTHNLELAIPLRKQTLRGHFLVVVFESMGRRIAALPRVPELAFDLKRGESLETRALEVLTAHFKKLEKKGNSPLNQEDYTGSDFARVTTMSIEIRSKQQFENQTKNRFAMLSGSRSMGGAAELEKVGRCLNRMFPRNLNRAILRDSEVEELDRHFRKRGNGLAKPVVLVGPSLVGKSAVIHEYLYRKLNADNDTRKRRELWLLSPQRMISGMMYVGQWEERAHSIFKEAGHRKHVLLFNDLTGLFQAGKSRDSDLTVGNLLKAYLEEESVQVMAEVTPEAWRKLREIDRGFADFFKVIHIREPGEEDTLRVLIRTLQTLEAEQKVRFDPEVLPEVLQLQRRFVRTRAFPGKGVEMLRQLAAHASATAEKTVSRADVFSNFERKTGISQQFLSGDAPIDPLSIHMDFETRIKGQDRAVEVMTNTVIACAKQMNDPNRPLASLLFLGPTGVGKTESAKALAAHFFGTDERLVRFDMNEFVGGDAVGRLIGTWARPQGLLTGAIRRQPYSVVLLDEIEKAHPAVFDLLLQLLGEGRLTDATGLTADFCNCIVIMTSNLGARAARHQLGFGGGSRDESSIYSDAAEKFFRPELFNRLDHIVPFGELTREHIESLVETLSRKALSRQGITGRRLSLTIDPGVNEKLADLGFKPEYGARALRRAIEHHLVEPLALQLSELPQNEPASVHLSLKESGELNFDACKFEPAERRCHRLKPVPLSRADDLLDALTGFVKRIDGELEEWFENEDQNGDGTYDPMDPRRVSYYNLREELDFLRRIRERFAGFAETEKKLPPGQRSRAGRFGKVATHLDVPELDEIDFLSQFYAAADTGKFLVDLGERSEIVDQSTHLAGELIYRANRIGFLARPEFQLPERVFLRLRDSSLQNHSVGKNEEHSLDFYTWEMYRSYLMSYLDWAVSPPNRDGWVLQRDSRTGKLNRYERDHNYLKEYIPFFDTAFIYTEGPGLSHWLDFEKGIQLFAGKSGAIDYTSFDVFPLTADERPEDAYDRVCATPPLTPKTAVTRIHHENGYLYDLQTGRITNDPKIPIWSLQMPLTDIAPEFASFFES
ncbi:MAG: ATP-dependent Clp protease ATP-binding subunit [Verrucomicrobiales bacterium]|nr:ATP-dependent Clp protease ATP-binding subunit [Verrucomicrobiales bacterium]